MQTRAALWLVLVLSCSAPALSPAPARAHAGDPNIQTVITGTAPNLAGVTIAVIQGTIAPAVSAVNETAKLLEVLGPDGVPFLRIGRGGVFANLSTPAFYRSSAPSGQSTGRAFALRSGERARWVRLSRGAAWAWYEPRIPDIPSAPSDVRGRSAPTRLARFTIPLRFAGRPASAQGEVDYRPMQGGSVARMTSPMQIAAGVTVALLPGAYPDVYLQNHGTETVTVIGQQGEPFAQIGPMGVRVNLRSPVHEADRLARGNSSVVRPEGAAPPLYQRVSTTPTYDWLDPRPRFLPKWSIPLRIGNRTYVVAGTLSFQPATTVDELARGVRARHHQAGSSSAWLIVAAVLAAVFFGGALWLRGGLAQR